MKTVKAVVFDFIGTLVTVEEYSYPHSERKLYECLLNSGFNLDHERFVNAYEKAHEKYRTLRYQELVEVTNAVWVSEALNQLNQKTRPQDERICAAINQFFEDYVRSLKPRSDAKKMLQKLKPHFALGLLSNFTYAPVIHGGLRKLGFAKYFNSILISEDFGWRKPSPRVFEETLRRLKVDGGETIYVGDSPEEDIRGAQKAGMKTIFIPSQFYTTADLEKATVHPDRIVKDLAEVLDYLVS